MKKKYFIILYLAFVLVVLLASSTLAKYVTTTSKESSFVIGNNLYFDYKRGDLFRNDQLIVGKEVEYEEDGVIMQRIETMNVVPGDNLVYHFFVSNASFEESSEEKNNIEAIVFPQAGATLEMPALDTFPKVFNIDCTISYRVISETGTPSSTFTMVTDDMPLPIAENEEVVYEFKVEVIVDDQVDYTTSDDYFGAVLTIYLFVDAASEV